MELKGSLLDGPAGGIGVFLRIRNSRVRTGYSEVPPVCTIVLELIASSVGIHAYSLHRHMSTTCPACWFAIFEPCSYHVCLETRPAPRLSATTLFRGPTIDNDCTFGPLHTSNRKFERTGFWSGHWPFTHRVTFGGFWSHAGRATVARLCFCYIRAFLVPAFQAVSPRRIRPSYTLVSCTPARYALCCSASVSF